MNLSFTRYYPWFFRLAVYAFAAGAFSYVTADPDLWGHVKFGEEIWSLGHIPETDSYSYTAAGHRWINHEWLMEILFFLLYDSFGSGALLLFKLALGLLIIHLLSNHVLKRATLPSVIYTLYFLLAIPVLAPAFMTRPHLATLLGTTLMILLLHKTLTKESEDENNTGSWIPWTAPLLFLIWTNAHGGVVAGLGMYSLALGWEGLTALRRGDPRWRRLILLLFASWAAVMINPYGYKLWLFFLESLGQARAIVEWAPVHRWSADHWQYKLLALLFAVSVAFDKNRRVWEIAIILLALIYGFKHQRHTVLAVIVLAPYLPSRLAAMWRAFGANKFRQINFGPAFHYIAAAGLVIFSLFQIFNAHTQYRKNDYRIVVHPTVYPTYLAQFMRDNGIDGNLVVPFDWGEYFIWKRPESKVSIDGRFRTAYPESVIQMNEDFEKGRGDWKRLLDETPADWVVAATREAVAPRMDRESGWEKIYQDPLAILYARKTDPPHPALKNFRDGRLINNRAPAPYHFPG